EDVQAVVSDASLLVLDRAIHGAFSGQLAQATQVCSREFAGGLDPGYVLGQGLRYALSLHHIRSEMEGMSQGMSVMEAVNRVVRVPLPIKKMMEQHAKIWPRVKLAKAIDILGEAIHRTRLEPALAEVIAIRAFWSVAFMVGA